MSYCQAVLLAFGLLHVLALFGIARSLARIVAALEKAGALR